MTQLTVKPFLFVLMFSSCALARSAQADVAIVVSARSGISALTAEQVSDIFLGKVKTLPNGTAVKPVDLPVSDDARAAFTKRVLGRSEGQLKAYWSRLVFTGAGLPPKEAHDGDEVKALIESDPSVIGYMSPDQINSSVKVVLTVQ
jgi:ABC-type phosphate transport system substrate-binding protein